MRWQGVARIVVAVGGVGTAIALFTLTRERKPSSTAAVNEAADPAATLQSGKGTQFRFKDGDKQVTIEYGSTRQHNDGRGGWTDLHFVMADGTDLKADEATTAGKTAADAIPGDVFLKGHVSMRTPEGVEIQAESMHYVDAVGRADIPGPVTFVHDRMSGAGMGATYERDTGVFNVLADAHVVIAAGPDGTGKLDAVSKTLTFNRVNNALLFDEQARITHDADVMAADRATLYMTPDHEQFRVIELRGHASVKPQPGSTSSTPDMQAQDIDLAFYEGTQVLQRAVLTRQAAMVMMDGALRRSISANVVVLTTAPDGKTLTHLDGTEKVVVKTPAQNGAPERTIAAAALVASGDDKKGLTLAQFSGGVRFEEMIPGPGGKAGAPRTGTSQALTMKLLGQLDAIDEAQFQQDVKFSDGDVTGEADLGLYLASKGKLTLKPFERNAKRPPHVTDGSVKIDASEYIDVNLDNDDVHARGSVVTVTAGQKAAGKSSDAGLFNTSDKTYGSALEFWYDGATKGTRYLGTARTPAKVWQQPPNDSSVVGVEIKLGNGGNDLTANGQVETRFPMTDQKPGAKTASMQTVTAESLDYKDSARTATYVGAPVIMTGADRSTSSSVLVLTLAAESRSLDRLEATTAVHALLAGNREARADSLLYEAALAKYTLRGQPVVIRYPGQPGSCSVVRGRVAYFTESEQSPAFPPEVNPGGQETKSYSGADCTGELKK